ncbi:DUF418 domain-containing protein [Streptomyces niveus]|uniref:DUF418 domain-containing protein n=1 Tax=Streptomyces niveus TaxID=193462 RepID=UPI003F540551
MAVPQRAVRRQHVTCCAAGQSAAREVVGRDTDDPAATVLRIAHGHYGQATVTALATAGRMSLTNYLGQSLVCALLFTGFGAALVGRVAPIGVAAIALALFAAQSVAGRWWLRHHAYGPLEWLLRAWTTLSLPRWRLQNETRSPRRGR